MISKKFFKSTLIYSVIGSLPFASGVILIFFFTSKLTPVDFGVNALYFSIMYFIQILSTFGLDTYIGIHYFDYKDDKKKLKENNGAVFVSLIIFGLFMLLALSVGGTSIFKLLFSDKYLQFFPWGFVTVLTAIFNGFLKTYSNLLINQQRPVPFFWLNFVNFLLVIIISLSFLYTFPFTLYGPMFGRLLPAFVSFCAVMYFVLKEYGLKYNPKIFKSIFDFCIPFVIYSLLIWCVSYIDRFIINHFLIDPSYVGIFDFAVKCTLFIDVFQTSLASAIHPKIYTIWKDNNLKESTPEVNRYYNGYTAITLLIIPLVVLLFPILIPFIVKKEIYYQSFAFLGILTIGFATRGMYNMFLAPVFFFKKTRVLTKVFAIVAVLQIIVTVILTKFFGLAGAVWANFLVKILQLLFLYSESRKFYNFKFNKTKILYLPLIVILMVISLEILFYHQYVIMKSAVEFLVTFALVFFVYKTEILGFYQKINFNKYLNLIGIK